MQKLHVLLRKEELNPERLEEKVAIVIDCLAATSTIATALQHGAADVLPVLDQHEGRTAASRQPPGSFVLAGEEMAQLIDGFGPPTPLALLACTELKGRRLIYSTTNGTVALRRSAGAKAVYAAALVNGRAVAEHVLAVHRTETVLLVCAGSAGRFSLEDYFAAGYLAETLTGGDPQRFILTDAAVGAAALYRRWPAEEALLHTRVGARMVRAGMGEEVRFIARTDQFDVVPALQDGLLRPLRRTAHHVSS